MDHLKDQLEAVEAKGGEGLMLRKALSHYEHSTRSSTLLKVGSFFFLSFQRGPPW